MTQPRARFLTLGLCLLIATPALAITVPPPPQREYVAQTWVAFSTDDSCTMRLTLARDGKGKGTLLYDAGRTEVFDVTSWELDHDRLTIDVRFRAPHERADRLVGSFKRYVLSYTEGMLPNPERIGEDWIPGRLELSMRRGKGILRFGAYPEPELLERLKNLGTSGSPSQ